MASVLLLLLVLGNAALAGAEETEPGPGLRYIHRTDPGPIELRAVVIDLSRPELSLVATRPEDRQITVSEFASRYGAVVAINGNYYGGDRTCGLAVSAGAPWGAMHSYPSPECAHVLGLSSQDNRAEIFETESVSELPAEWITDAVTGRPRLLTEGVAEAFDCPAAGGLVCDAYARAAVGLSADRRTLVLLVVDKGDTSLGVDAGGLANLLRELGAADGFSLDYGGSAALYVATEGGLVSCPSDLDCREREVVNHLGVRVDPDGAWFAAQLAGQAPDPAAAIAPGETVERVVRYTNTGRSAWASEGTGRVLLATAEPADHASPLQDPDSWISASRAVAVEGTTPPGEDGTFRLLLRGANLPGVYSEAFGLVAVGPPESWLDAEPARWTVTVDGPADADGDGHDEETDCDDGDAAIYPGAPERCNGLDDDCDSETDEGIEPGRSARVVWTAAASGTLRVNGRIVDRSERWQEVRTADVHLPSGTNVVGIVGERGDGQGGVLATIWLPDGDRLPSNTRWEAATSPGEGWDSPGGSDEGFSRATISAYLGDPPFDEELQGWPAELATDGVTWIWSARPGEDRTAYLRRRIVEPAECATDLPGACSLGRWQCVEGAVGCAPAVLPDERAETCNGIDDDCDGLTDEWVVGCSGGDDAGTPPPDLGPDIPTAEIVVTPERTGAGDERVVSTGCSAAASEPSAPPLGALLLLLGLPWARRRPTLRRSAPVPCRPQRRDERWRSSAR